MRSTQPRSSLISRLLVGCALTLVTSASTPPADAQPAAAVAPAPGPRGKTKGRYMGPHPVAARPNGGYCYIDVPHSHDYGPDRPALYQQVGDNYVFTGDPTPFGYDGQKTVFYGHHPVPVAPSPDPVVPVAASPTFCFIKGPHNHDYPQPAGPGYKTQNDVVFYVGPIPPEVARLRPQQEQAVEVEYRPYVAQRPKVVVTPPPEWAGVVWVPPPVTTVVAPHPAVVVAPQPAVVVAPQPTVVVAPPRPVVVAPAPIIVAPTPGIIMMHGHGHGHGWGKGHFKGGKGHFKHW